jgi:MFS family permease
VKSVGYRQLIAGNPAFRRLWLGDVSSFLGDWFNLIALYTAVQAITDSKLAVALVMVVKTLPNFLMVPIAGPIVDRYDRRKLLLAMDWIRAACTIGLVVCHHAHSLTGLYAFAFAMVLCTGVAFPAKKAALPQLVPAEHISTANALTGGTWSVMLAVGAALGGLATEWLGVTAALLIDGITFLVSAAIFYKLPALAPPARDDRDKTSFVEGLRYLRRTPYVQALTCLKPFMSFANGAMVLIPIYGTVAFGPGGGALFIGLLYAARGFGAAVGSFAIRMIIGDQPRALRRWMVLAYLLMGGSLLYLAQAGSLLHAAIGFFGCAMGSGSIWVFSGTLLQLEADAAYHGRIFSLEFGVTTLVLAASAFSIGLALDWGLSLEEATTLAAGLTVPPLLYWLAVLALMRHRDKRDVAAIAAPAPLPPV